MKKCCNCKTSKELSEFGKWSKSKDGLQSRCKECQRLYNRELYASSSKRRTKIREVDSKNKLLIKEKVDDYKSRLGCAECGESNPIVLDFDHLEGKSFNISLAVNKGYSWPRISKEIEKCDVVCANHHRIRTHKRRVIAQKGA